MEALLPHLGLIVSGGNTLLCAIDRDRRITVISSTRDDAAGEALDKGAKLLGLGYPGGPLIERLALGGRKDAHDFPRGIGRRAELDFSFSGLKTSLRYTIERMSPAAVEAGLADLCASYQQAVIDALLRKTRLSLERTEFASVGLSGGVANNRALRAAAETEAQRARIPLLCAEPRHTGDNAGMIAFAAWVDRQGAERGPGMGLTVKPGLALGRRSGSGVVTTQVAREQAEFLAVFCHGAPGDGEAFFLQLGHELLITERLGAVLHVDQIGNHLLDAGIGDRGSAVGLVTGGEEIFEFENAVRGLDVFVRDGPAHGRLVDPDDIGDLGHGERLQMRYTVSRRTPPGP
jgi:hypothetical protein